MMTSSSVATLLATIVSVTLLVTRMTSARHSHGDGRHRHHQFITSTSGLVYCTRDNDCQSTDDSGLSDGETCHWLYEGCSVGLCRCDPLTEKKHPHTGHCIPARYGGETCNSTQTKSCPAGMFCSVTGRCECHAGQMTSDGQFCQRFHHKLITSRCNPTSDRCFQRAVYGYTSSEVACDVTQRECVCTEGRQSGITCTPWRLYERGCSKFDHCKGGAICVDGQCVCPSGYAPSSTDINDDTKCVKRDAVRGLGLGAECDEINERSYCADGLVCHRCSPDDVIYRCVRFRLVQLMKELRYYRSGATTTMMQQLVCLVSWLSVSCAILSRVSTSLR